MVKSSRPAANGFVAAARHIYNPIGFGKGYNFILWFLTIGYLFAFSLSRTSFFSYYGVFCNREVIASGKASGPGECFYYLRNPYKIGMMLHLFCILPSGILVCFQFVPVIRHKVMLFHRLNGYLVILLSTIANAGAIIIAPHAQGGDMSTRMIAGVLVISTTAAYTMAWINIKRLQIDQHRAWMMRAWAYFACIITLRLIMFIYAVIVSKMADFDVIRPCVQIDWLFGNQDYVLSLYPQCAPYYSGANPQQQVIVKADYYSTNAMEISASLGVGFGAAAWLAFWIHAIAIELYLRLTPAENERLKEVSYQRQRERGFRNPGAAGLVAEKLGDANPYVPISQRRDVSNGEELDMLAKNHRDCADDIGYHRAGL